MEYIKIQLPEMKAFKSNKNDRDPFLKFYDFITKTLKTDIRSFEVSNVHLNIKDYDKLKEKAFSWFKKQDGVRILNDKYKERQFSFHDANIGPYGKEDLETGFIYIKKDWNKKK